MVIARDMKFRAARLAILLGLFYLIVALGWILGSDALALRLAADNAQYILFQNFKGIAFVTVMAIIIGILTYRLYLSHEVEARARTLATTDMVTQLTNQSSLQEALATQARYLQAPFGLILFDVLNFGNINASLGRERGDLLLFRIGRRLLAATGDDCVVARIESDKFAVLTPALASPEKIHELAERCLAALNREYPAGDHVLELQIYAGYAVAWPDRPLDGTQLLNAADAALERAKRERVHRLVRFDPEIERSRSAQFRMEIELREALRNGQLDVHFQPQVRLADGHIRGAEALVRWHHPEKGMISPGIFIPVAEQSGLIDDIGGHVIEKTFESLQELRAIGHESLVLSINIAGHQLDSGALPSLLSDARKRWDMPMEQIEIEVTETMALQKPEIAISYLQEIRNLGATIALDDFGTGVSSLQYLLDLPIDVLKIDRAFIAGLPDDTRQARFVTTILDLAQDLELEVVAEGVETQGQKELLTRLGCHYAQGFLLARPMPLTELKRWLSQQPASAAASFAKNF
jgi:diguanylate cyclase (GGDEF)-like protein